MGRFAPFLPELILTVGGIVLMMVAALAGRRAAGAGRAGLRSRCCLRATVALIGAPSHAGPVFDGMITADLFAQLRQGDHLPRGGGRDHRRARLVRARCRAWRRIFGADPVRRGRHERDGLGDQPDLALRRSRADRASRATCWPPTAAPTSARPRRASNISCSARSPAASCSTASRCSTASPARPASPASPPRSRAGRRRWACCSAWCSCSPGSPSRSARCRSTCGRPTSTKARRRRSPPSSPRRRRSRRCCCATRVCLDALGPATDAWRQIVIFAALASIFLGAIAAYGQTNIKRLLAYSSINNVGFALIGLAAAGTRRALRRCCSTWRSMS